MLESTAPCAVTQTAVASGKPQPWKTQGPHQRRDSRSEHSLRRDKAPHAPHTQDAQSLLEAAVRRSLMAH